MKLQGNNFSNLNLEGKFDSENIFRNYHVTGIDTPSKSHEIT